MKRAGYKIGIVSSTSTRLIVTALNRIKLMSLREVLICGDMVTKKKQPGGVWESNGVSGSYAGRNSQDFQF